MTDAPGRVPRGLAIFPWAVSALTSVKADPVVAAFAAAPATAFAAIAESAAGAFAQSVACAPRPRFASSFADGLSPAAVAISAELVPAFVAASVPVADISCPASHCRCSVRSGVPWAATR